jgi:hypothetical protein
MANPKPLTPGEFGSLQPALKQQLMEALAKEQQDCALPDPETDLWDFPPVDSKTVAKLSPVVKELTGFRLRPTWIRKGGYESIEEAVHDLIAQIQKHCVTGSPVTTPSKDKDVALTP